MTSESTVRLYGRVMGHGSHAQVTRGFEAALRTAGLLSGVVGLDVLGLDDQVGTVWAREGSGDARATHGVFTGPLDMLEQMMRSGHERRWVMVAPNSNWMPERFIKGLEAVATDILVPSAWAATMLIPLLRGASPEHPSRVRVVPHGVHVGFERSAEQHAHVVRDFEAGQFRVLHCSTSERQRKGTWELLQAWDAIKRNQLLPEAAELILVLDYAAQLRFAEKMLDANLSPPNVIVVTRLDAEPAAMADVLRRVHVVCQPSRAEAFGLVPLEALACGTPVVATRCTGHRYLDEVASRGVVRIYHGSEEPIDDGPGAHAPRVSVAEIADALCEAHEEWNNGLADNAFYDAACVVREWSWTAQLASWIKELQ